MNPPSIRHLFGSLNTKDGFSSRKADIEGRYAIDRLSGRNVTWFL
jgi:hypothetical protein